MHNQALHNQRVLIIGAGIAGTAAAMAFQRVGIEATIYEAYEGTAHGVGGALGVATNGFDVLRTLGVADQVSATGWPTTKIALWNGAGRRLGIADDGTIAVTAERARLYDALYGETVRRGIPIEHGKRLVGVEHQGEQVIARFDDGTSASGTVLVGADGMYSAVRELVAPDAPKPHYVGLTGCGDYSAPMDLGLDPSTFHMVFGKRAFFGYAGLPDGRVGWFANVPTPVEPTGDDLTAVPLSARRAQLLDLFANDNTPATRIVEATERVDLWLALYHMDPPRHWYRDRMVLIGDAARAPSPSSGQGASLALEDALELAKCLRDRPDPASAFATFQQLRDKRVAKVMAAAKRINSNKAAGPVGRVIRDALAPVAMKLFTRPNARAWLYQHHIELDEPLLVH
ncbi:MAG TPA: FAD-dependent monooxygenase [Pseudonocardiaceae bacterium]|jgi:2-polyprenyl-6-methoxyphenol hydroxylase-like FAD-dependent oxidoreductase